MTRARDALAAERETSATTKEPQQKARRTPKEPDFTTWVRFKRAQKTPVGACCCDRGTWACCGATHYRVCWMNAKGSARRFVP
jgi:hypothetical protein